MNIFISYSTEDLSLVNQIADYLKHHATVRYWAKDKKPGEKDWDQIFEWIDESDLMLAVITDNAVARGIAVGSEIGYAKKHEVGIIPVVADNVSESHLGCLKGITYERIDRDNPGPALEKVARRVREIKRQDFIEDCSVLAAVVGLIWLASRSK